MSFVYLVSKCAVDCKQIDRMVNVGVFAIKAHTKRNGEHSSQPTFAHLIRLTMSKLKTCHSFLIGYVALVVLLSGCVMCQEDLKIVPTDVDAEGIKEANDTLTEWANKAELAFDGWRTWYCQEFQTYFYQNATAWSTVMAQCIDPLLLKAKPHTNVVELHAKCAKLVENPCIMADWVKLKTCVRQKFMLIPNDGVDCKPNFFLLFFDRASLLRELLKPGISKCTFQSLGIHSGQ